MLKHLLSFGRVVFTAVVVIVALIALRYLWDRYELDPWTRDGRVRPDAVQVAPDVSALVTDVFVHDNQTVKKGQALFVIDQPRFELALRQSEAAVASAQARGDETALEDKRNHNLGNLVSTEVLQQGGTRLAEAQAALAQAVVAHDTAKL